MIGIFLLAMLVVPATETVPPSINMPAVFEADFSWRREMASDAERPVFQLVIRARLHDGLDRDRLVFRIDGIDMKPILFNANGAGPSQRVLEVEIPFGQATVELAIFEVDDQEALYQASFETAAPRTRLVRGATGDSASRPVRVQVFPPDEIPPDIPSDVLPPGRER